MAQVSIRRIHKHFGTHHALKDVSLEIPSGTFFTLLGPSGCGKTTLLRAIAGFHFQDSGDIVVDDRSFGRLNAAERNVGMVFQDYAIFPHLSVFDNVAFGLNQRKRPKAEIAQQVQALLDMVQLGDQGAKMPHQLSGGQQQRVGLARALVIHPQLLLMDEPLSNLDAKLRIELRQDIRRTQQRLGITTIYVTHDQEEALSVSDLICVMDVGEVQQVGTPWEIYQQPVNRFVASFVGANHFVEVTQRDGFARWLGVDWAVPVAARTHTKLVLAVRPEKIRIEPRSGEGVGVSARLSHAVFSGRELQLVLTAASGETVEALVPPTEAMVALKAGDAVRMQVEPGDLRWFAPGARGARLA